MKEDVYTDMYIIEGEEIKKCPIKRTIDTGPNNGAVVQYLVGPNKIHSYTEGQHSYDIGQRFHIDLLKCVLSFYKMFGYSYVDHEIYRNGFNYETIELIEKVKDENPEYFI